MRDSSQPANTLTKTYYYAAVAPNSEQWAIQPPTSSDIPLGSPYSGVVGIGGAAGSTASTTKVTYAALPGSLPPGLSLNAATGAITGTPTTAGSWQAWFIATDTATGAQHYASVVLVVDAAG